MIHVRKVCECGVVLLQCRCMGPTETVYVSPCVHYFSTHSVASFEPISLEQMHAVYMEYISTAPQIPNVLKVHPGVYNAIVEYFMKQEAEEELMGIKRPEESAKSYVLGKIFGVQIVIDRSLKPGEWRFEDVHATSRGIQLGEETKRLAARILSDDLRVGIDAVAKGTRITGLQTS